MEHLVPGFRTFRSPPNFELTITLSTFFVAPHQILKHLFCGYASRIHSWSW